MKKYNIVILLFFSSVLTAQNLYDNYFLIQDHYKEILDISNNNQRFARNNWLHRWLWLNQFSFDKNGNLNFDNLNYHNLKQEPNKILSNYNWTPVGPIDIPPTYDPRSCYSMGRVNCIAFHPTDKNIFWIGTPGGGIWKTVDYGKTWMPTSDFLGSLAISHIAVNPNNPDSIWAATGDFDTSGLINGNTIGVILSTDGGNTWQTTSLINEKSFGNSTLRKIIINPKNTRELLVAGRQGIWKTIDAGQSWTKVCDSIITDIEINPRNPEIVFAAMGQLYGNGSAGVLQSTNFGSTWEVLNTGIPPKGEISRVELAIAPSYPDYIYVVTVNSRTNGFHSFYCSTDGGKSWTKQSELDSTNNILGAWGGDISDKYGQGSYDLAMIVDQNDKNTIYVGGINIWMSQTMGREWEIASFWIYVFGESTHADQHWVEYNPLDKNYYWCNDGGVYRTKKLYPGDKNWIINWIDKYDENIKPGAPNVKFQTKWENISNGLAITEFYRVTISKNEKYVMAGGSQDNSCFYYNNGRWLNYIPNYDGMETMIDHENPDVFYGVWQNGGLCKTTDGGKTIRTRLNASIPEYGRWITPVAMDPQNSNHLLMGFRNLWESTDGGETWQKLLDFSQVAPNSMNTSTLSITQYHQEKNNFLVVYRPSSYYQDTTSKSWVRAPGELWITTNGGKDWQLSKANLPLDSLDIVSIEFNRYNPLEMFAAFNTSYQNINLYQSTDGGNTWIDISKKLPSGIRINMIKLHNEPSQTPHQIIYAGTNKGVYYAKIDDSLWTSFNDNLPLTIVNDIELHLSTGEIFAATYGRGMWKTNLINFTTVPNNNSISFDLYPNPSKNVFYITVPNQVPNFTGEILITIIDVMGYEQYKKKFTRNHTLKIEHNLASGVYYVILESNEIKLTGKIIVNK